MPWKTLGNRWFPSEKLKLAFGNLKFPQENLEFLIGSLRFSNENLDTPMEKLDFNAETFVFCLGEAWFFLLKSLVVLRKTLELF